MAGAKESHQITVVGLWDPFPNVHCRRKAICGKKVALQNDFDRIVAMSNVLTVYLVLQNYCQDLCEDVQCGDLPSGDLPSDDLPWDDLSCLSLLYP
jgi:hypothetical protein